MPISIIIIVGLLATKFDFDNYRKTYDLTGLKLYFFSWAQNTVGWGFLACSTFMFTNYYLAESDLKQSTLKIVDKSSMTGSRGNRSKRKPLITIIYNGEKKELVFPNTYYDELGEFKTVSLQTRTGFLNFDVIENQELNK